MFDFKYLPKQAYRNPLSGTLIGLIGGADRAHAQQAEQEGAISAQEGQAFAGQAASTLNTLLQYSLKKQDPAYKLEQAKLAGVTQDQADDKMIRGALSDNGGDLSSALSQLRSTGAVGMTAAGKLENQLLTQQKEKAAAQKEALSGLDDNLKRTGTQIDLASKLLRTVPDPVVDPDTGESQPHPDAPAAYYAIAPKLKELLGPQLGSRVPDTYDPAITSQMKQMGESTKDTLDKQRGAVEAAKMAIDAKKDSREQDAYFTKALGLGLSTAQSQEEWDKQLAVHQALGGNPATAQKFSPTYSPDAAKQALTLATSPDEISKLSAPPKAPEPGSLAAAATSYAKEKKVPVETLSYKDNLTIARQWAQAHRDDKPEDMTPARTKEMVDTVVKFPSVYNDLTDTMKGKLAPDLAAAGFTGFGAPSKSTAAGAERWRASQITQLKKDKANGDQAIGAVVTPEEYAQREAEINASYRVQIGAAGTSANPPTLGADSAPLPAPAAPVQPKTPVVLPKGLVPGATVKLKSGKTVKVKTVNPDGTFTYE